MPYKFRNPGPWGPGATEDLDAIDIDNNFWQSIQDIQAKAAQGVGIANIITSGSTWTVVLTDHTLLGPYPLPVVEFIFKGEWLPNYAYLGGSIITHGGATYFIPINHTSEATFDPGANDGHGTNFYELLLQNAPTSLDDLLDVNVTTPPPVQGATLVYDSGLWIAGSPSGTLVGLSDVQQSPPPSVNDLIQWNGSFFRYVNSSSLVVPASIATCTDVRLGDHFDLAISNPLSYDDVLVYRTNLSKWINYPRAPYNTWSGVNKTLQLDDASNYLNMQAVGFTITVPTFASVAFPHNTYLYIRQNGNVSISILAASGVTINVPPGRIAKTRANGSVVRLYKVGFGSTQNSWELSGDLAYDTFDSGGPYTIGGTLDPSSRDTEVVRVTPTFNSPFSVSSAPLGARLTMIITTSGTTSYSVQFGSGFKSQGNLATGTVSGKVFVVSFIGDGTNMNEISRTTAM
jgi:hypothetical protein